MKALVAGLGMLGVNVVAELRRQGHDVEGMDVAPDAAARSLNRLDVKLRVHRADITDFLQLASVVQTVAPDYLINTTVSRATDTPSLMARVNVMGLVNLLEAARMFKVVRVVHASSSTVYGTAKRAAERSGRISEGELINFSDTFYGATKQAAESIGHNYRQHYGVDFVALRFCHIFGGGSASTGMAIENLVRAAVEERPAMIENRRSFWNGREDFIYVKDAARALVAACTPRELKQRVMNVTMGALYSFEEIVELVRSCVNPNLAVNRDRAPDSPFLRGPLAAPYDTGLAYEQMGFKPEYDMKAAILDYADMIRAS